MRTVWKFELPVQDDISIAMPLGAKLLHVDVQHGKPCLWALVDNRPALRTERRKLHTRGTGHNADGLGAYVGSYQLDGGGFVGHVFEGLEP